MEEPLEPSAKTFFPLNSFSSHTCSTQGKFVIGLLLLTYLMLNYDFSLGYADFHQYVL